MINVSTERETMESLAPHVAAAKKIMAGKLIAMLEKPGYKRSPLCDQTDLIIQVLRANPEALTITTEKRFKDGMVTPDLMNIRIGVRDTAGFLEIPIHNQTAAQEILEAVDEEALQRLLVHDMSHEVVRQDERLKSLEPSVRDLRSGTGSLSNGEIIEDQIGNAREVVAALAVYRTSVFTLCLKIDDGIDKPDGGLRPAPYRMKLGRK